MLPLSFIYALFESSEKKTKTDKKSIINLSWFDFSFKSIVCLPTRYANLHLLRIVHFYHNSVENWIEIKTQTIDFDFVRFW